MDASGLWLALYAARHWTIQAFSVIFVVTGLAFTLAFGGYVPVVFWVAFDAFVSWSGLVTMETGLFCIALLTLLLFVLIKVVFAHTRFGIRTGSAVLVRTWKTHLSIAWALRTTWDFCWTSFTDSAVKPVGWLAYAFAVIVWFFNEILVLSACFAFGYTVAYRAANYLLRTQFT